MESDFVLDTLIRCFPCRKKDSLCCWGREAVSSFELLVLCKTPSLNRMPSSSPTLLDSGATASDVEARCKRLASKLAEITAPEHFVSAFY